MDGIENKAKCVSESHYDRKIILSFEGIFSRISSKINVSGRRVKAVDRCCSMIRYELARKSGKI